MVAKQLEQAIEQLTKLPEEEQIAFAEWMLEELQEREWQKRFDATRPMLRRMAQEARREIEAGEFDDLDLDDL
jgi:hypothetical protein